jgi:hypothetical protein
MTATGAGNKWHLETKYRWVNQYNFYLQDAEWEPMFVRVCPYFPNPKTKMYSQRATVTNSGSSSVAGPLSLVLSGLAPGVTLSDRNGSTVCFAPPNSPYINLNLPASNRLGVGKSAQTVLQFSDPSNTGISFTSEVAGPGAR